MTFGWSGAWAELRAVDTAARAMVPGFVDLRAVSALPSPAFGKLVLDVRPPVAYGSERLTSTARDGWSDDHQARTEKRPRLSHDHGEAGAFDSLIRALGPRPERAFADVV